MSQDEHDIEEHPDFVGVDHVTITVQDVDLVKHFYSELIGLRVRTDVTVEGETTWGGFAIKDGEVVEIGKVTGGEPYDNPHPVRRMVIFERIGGTSLTLIGHPGDTLKGERATKLDRLGYTHLAFDVRDLEAYRAKLEARGVKPTAPGFYQDPEGNFIQFQESGQSEQVHTMYRDRYLPSA